MPNTLEGPYNFKGFTDPLNLQVENPRFRVVGEEGTGNILPALDPLLGSFTAGVPQGSPTWVSGSCWACRQSPEVGRSPWGQSCQSPW